MGSMTAPDHIALTAMEPGGAHRTAFPVTVGVPFAPGALRPDQPLSIRDASGRDKPLQHRVMETHDDGSVRWLLLDYQTDFQPLKETTDTLAIGRACLFAPPDR